MKYFIVKKFTGGLLEGITYEEITTIRFTVGQRVDKPYGGSPYEIITVIPLK